MPRALTLVAKGSNGTVETENQITKRGTEPTIKRTVVLCLDSYVIPASLPVCH